MAVGVSDHADEGVLRQWFQVFALGTAAEGAELTIAIRRPGDDLACPHCAGIALQTSHSDLCEVCSAVVERGARTEER